LSACLLSKNAEDIVDGWMSRNRSSLSQARSTWINESLQPQNVLHLSHASLFSSIGRIYLKHISSYIRGNFMQAVSWCKELMWTLTPTEVNTVDRNFVELYLVIIEGSYKNIVRIEIAI
jgi:hypothetical protein